MVWVESLFRSVKMATSQRVRIKSPPSPAHVARLLLLFLLQSFVVLLAGFAALMLDF
jgi:hypothetical protein